MTTEEIEEKLREDAQKLDKYFESNVDERMARVFKRIKEIEEEERKNGSSNRLKHGRKIY